MSNHLGDTNKMVETPRTDAHIDGLRRDPEVSGCDRTINFCRQLERELNAANSRIELLMSANADVARIAGERDAAEKRVKRLEAVVKDPHALWTNWLRGDVKLPAGIGDVRQYQDRIKRLEEAGDEFSEILSSKTPKANCLCHIAPPCSDCVEHWGSREALVNWRKAKEAKP